MTVMRLTGEHPVGNSYHGSPAVTSSVSGGDGASAVPRLSCSIMSFFMTVAKAVGAVTVEGTIVGTCR